MQTVCKWASLGLVALMGILLAGCDGGSTSGGQTNSITLPDKLTLTLSENRSAASVSGIVTYQVNLTNRTSAPITDTFAGYPSNSDPQGVSLIRTLTVQNTAGGYIGSDGNPELFPPRLSPQAITITLQPGQTLPLTVPYTFIKADTYTATVVLQHKDLSVTPSAGPVRVVVR